jgi:aminoglycoside phosphotransferase
MVRKNRTQINPPDEIAELIKGFTVKAVWHGYVADVFFCSDPKGLNSYYLKRHKLKTSHDSVKECEVINWLQDKLIVPKVKCFTEDGKYYYLLLTALPGIPAHTLIRKIQPENMIKILVKAMRELHAIPLHDCPFDESTLHKLSRVRRNIDHGYLRKDIYNKHSKRSAESDLKYLQDHLPAREELVFTHGDFCLPNFLVTNQEVTGYIDLGEAGPCDLYMDLCTLAITMCFNYKRPDNFFYYCRLIFEEYGITKPDWAKLHYYQLLNEIL